MPRLGVPSTTDSARVMADVCGEPAPLPRSTNPRHYNRPGGTFRASFNPLIETPKRDERKALGALPRGESRAFKRPRDGGGFMSRADFKRSAGPPSMPRLIPGLSRRSH